MSRRIEASFLGRIDYGKALAMQEDLLARRMRKEVGDTLLLLEHDPVITLGRGAKRENILADEAVRAGRGVALHETGRGGDVTYHGPGQLVAYPIFDLKPERCDVRKYVADLGAVMVGLCADFGIGAGYLAKDHVGVWVDLDAPKKWEAPETMDTPQRNLGKIGAIGVRISRWITMHGFAFNVTTNASDFDLIVPCGIKEYGPVSLTALGVTPPPLEDVARRAANHFGRIFDAEVTWTPR